MLVGNVTNLCKSQRSWPLIYSHCWAAAPPIAHIAAVATCGMHRIRMPFGPGCSVMAIVSSAATAAARPDCDAVLNQPYASCVRILAFAFSLELSVHILHSSRP